MFKNFFILQVGSCAVIDCTHVLQRIYVINYTVTRVLKLDCHMSPHIMAFDTHMFIPEEPLYNRNIELVHINHCPCMRMCNTVRYLSMLTYKYVSVDITY